MNGFACLGSVVWRVGITFECLGVGEEMGIHFEDEIEGYFTGHDLLEGVFEAGSESQGSFAADTVI